MFYKNLKIITEGGGCTKTRKNVLMQGSSIKRYVYISTTNVQYAPSQTSKLQLLYTI